MARILLTDGEQRSTLAATRSLGRAGHTVTVLSRHPAPLAGASKHARAVSIHPDPGADPAGFREALDRAVRATEADVLLPMTDVSVPFALELRERHPQLRIPFPDAATYHQVSDKRRLLEVAEGLGVPVPRQATLEAAAGGRELEAVVAPLGFPLVIKPARSAVEGPEGTRRFGVSIAADLSGLQALVRAHPPEAFPLLLQEQVRGPGLGVFALFWEGEPVAWFAHRRLREKPPTGGVSVYRESVALRDDLREHATRLLAHHRWSGVAMVEFKEDRDTGTPYLMEINGRFWGSLQLAIDAGVDFPRLLVALALGEDPAPVASTPRTGIRSRWLLGDLDHLLALVRHGAELRRTHPGLPGPVGALGRFLVPWRPGDRFEVLRVGDPGPFFREVSSWFREVRGRAD